MSLHFTQIFTQTHSISFKFTQFQHHEKENNEGSNVETIKGDQIEKEEEQEGDNGSEQQRQRPKELLIENGLLVLNHGE